MSLTAFVWVLFVALPVSAGPFIVCDPPPQGENVNSYALELNGDSIPLPPDPTGQYGFKYDLAGEPDGSYTARAQACNTPENCSGWSDVLDFTLTHK
jgi:hypothetical protein